MTFLLWTIQLLLDGAIIAILVVAWQNRKNLAGQGLDAKVVAYFNVMEAKTVEWEKKIQLSRATLDGQLQVLVKICNRAKEILGKSQTQVSAFPPSQEESELASLFPGENFAETPISQAPPIPSPQIPTVRELESSKNRFQSEVALDLKTILRDQLA